MCLSEPATWMNETAGGRNCAASCTCTCPPCPTHIPTKPNTTYSAYTSTSCLRQPPALEGKAPKASSQPPSNQSGRVVDVPTARKRRLLSPLFSFSPAHRDNPPPLPAHMHSWSPPSSRRKLQARRSQGAQSSTAFCPAPPLSNRASGPSCQHTETPPNPTPLPHTQHSTLPAKRRTARPAPSASETPLGQVTAAALARITKQKTCRDDLACPPSPTQHKPCRCHHDPRRSQEGTYHPSSPSSSS